MESALRDQFSEAPEPVLLVEDNFVNQKVAMLLLGRFGLEAELACNGKEALSAVMQRNYSVILMDCHMPIMDGFESTVLIRQFETRTGGYTPIIAVTALAMAGDRERCIACGMDDYIPKPIDIKLLKEKLDHWTRTDVVLMNKHKQSSRKHLRSVSRLVLMDKAPVDLKGLLEDYGLDALRELFSIFLSSSSDNLANIGTCLEARNTKGVSELAHELRASCASLHFKQLSQLSLFLELTAGQNDWLEAFETYNSMKRLFANFQVFAQEIFAEEPVGSEA